MQLYQNNNILPYIKEKTYSFEMTDNTKQTNSDKYKLANQLKWEKKVTRV